MKGTLLCSPFAIMLVPMLFLGLQKPGLAWKPTSYAKQEGLALPFLYCNTSGNLCLDVIKRGSPKPANIRARGHLLRDTRVAANGMNRIDRLPLVNAGITPHVTGKGYKLQVLAS